MKFAKERNNIKKGVGVLFLVRCDVVGISYWRANTGFGVCYLFYMQMWSLFGRIRYFLVELLFDCGFLLIPGSRY